MFKGKLAASCLVAVTLLVVGSTAFAGIIDPCLSDAVIVADNSLVTVPRTAPFTFTGCPQGDFNSQQQQGHATEVTVVDGSSVGIPNIPGSDLWYDDCDSANDLFILCGGSAASNADGLTNASGRIDFSLQGIAVSTRAGAIGGTGGLDPACSNGVTIIVQGIVLEDAANCGTVECFTDLKIRSFDIWSDPGTDLFRVDLTDLSSFAFGYPGGSASPNDCVDYDALNANDLADLSLFAFHYGPPSHICQ
jgi:hypothetical protein